MAKKPTEIEAVEEVLPEQASTEPPPDGYVLVKQADWDELQRNLKMAR